MSVVSPASRPAEMICSLSLRTRFAAASKRASGEPGFGLVDRARVLVVPLAVLRRPEVERLPAQNHGDGRNHHPYGYVTAFIGATITAAEKGIYGAIGPDAIAPTAATPAENRIAALLALGIWPFSHEAFAVSDVTGANSEAGAAAAVTKNVLGVTL